MGRHCLGLGFLQQEVLAAGWSSISESSYVSPKQGPSYLVLQMYVVLDQHEACSTSGRLGREKKAFNHVANILLLQFLCSHHLAVVGIVLRTMSRPSGEFVYEFQGPYLGPAGVIIGLPLVCYMLVAACNADHCLSHLNPPTGLDWVRPARSGFREHEASVSIS